MSAQAAPFPIVESFIKGVRALIQHGRLMMVLSVFPFAVTLATMIALRIFGDGITMFWLPVVQIPASFVTGLEVALILRFLLLAEFPIIPDSDARATRNRMVMQSALAYTVVTYCVTGAYAGLFMARNYLTLHPEAAAPYVPLLIGAMVLIVWSLRWFWLHVPLAPGWSVHGFYERLGKWGGSLRVAALFVMCSLTLNIIAAFLHTVINTIARDSASGFVAAFEDAIVAGASLMLAVLFATSTAAAVQAMTKAKLKDGAA